ncbi:hypothetical protein [Chryseobacterium sp. SIMBA_029]|uniref:hypothetical protein n=1 Tax=Chryseobacterium sp. SIMBA_029 TaxID=3085772 RepID=UPI00397A2C54
MINFKAQVGINTSNPQGTLDVNGRTLGDSYLIDGVNSISTDNYYLLTRSTDTTPVGKVKKLDVSLRNVAPVNMYNITIQNVQQDEVVNLNTNLETGKYVVAIVGAVFSGAALNRNSDGSFGAYYNEITKVTVGSNTYHAINLDFKGGETTSLQKGTWNLSLVVYEKVLVKDWGNYAGSVSSASSYKGASTTTPAGLQ